MNQSPRHQFVQAVSSPSGSVETADTIDVGAVLGTLWRSKLLICLMFALFGAAGAFYAYRVATPQYRSTAVVMLNAREEKVLDIGSVVGALSAESSVVNSELEVLKSRSLLAKLVTQHGLDTDPEFNRYLRSPGLIAQAKLWTKRTLGLTTAATPLSPADSDERAREATIDGLLGRLTIRNQPQSLVFQVTAQTSDPKKSAYVANALVSLYVGNQLDAKKDATDQATSWLSGRVQELQRELERAETKVKVFQARTDLVSPQSLAALEVQLKDIRDRIGDAKLTDAQALARIDAIKSGGDRVAVANALNDPQLIRLLPALGSARGADAFDARLREMDVQARVQAERGSAQRVALETSRAALESQIAQQSDDLIALQQLSREAEASRLLYEYFLARLKETSAQQGIQQADSRVLSRAVVPTLPASPNRPVIVGLSGLLGLILASILVLLREARSDTFRTAQQLESATKRPVMGQLARMPARKHAAIVRYLSKKPMSASAEAIRNLRTSVMLSSISAPPKVIATCSALPGEGKTTVAFAMAQNFAAMGQRVLLIEGDIRRRTFAKTFGVRSDAGLQSVVMGTTALKDTVQTVPDLGVDVLFAESKAIHAVDLFSSDAYADLIANARETYDQIVVDTPPVLIVPDARWRKGHRRFVRALSSGRHFHACRGSRKPV